MTSLTISTTTVKRLISDIKEIKKNPLSKDGIFYKHDESNMLLGYALIIGPENTPYAYGNFLFKFNFPSDYPYSPPKVTYCTNDGVTRFNPNLYKDGKVCLSVLNTWKGEQWTGCQTIRSILLVLCSILNDKPLINEPGILESHKDFKSYNKIIRYKTHSTAINKILSKKVLPNEFNIFYDEIVENFINNYGEIMKNLEDISNKNNETITTGIYNLCIRPNYNKLKEDLNVHYNKMRPIKPP